MIQTSGGDTGTDAGENMNVTKEELIWTASFLDEIDMSLTEPVLHSVLLCARCRRFLVKFDDIIAHRREDIWKEQVYAYDLDIFDNKPPLWCYSATNPTTRRFDVVCCAPTIATKDHVVAADVTYSDQHSFFVGYKWSFCNCENCNSFIGWAFSPVAESFSGDEAPVTDSPKPSFIALIITMCVSRDDYPVEKIDECVRTATDRYEFRCKRDLLEMFFWKVLHEMEDKERVESLGVMFRSVFSKGGFKISLKQQRYFINKAVDLMQVDGEHSESGQDVKSKLIVFLEEFMNEIMKRKRTRHYREEEERYEVVYRPDSEESSSTDAFPHDMDIHSDDSRLSFYSSTSYYNPHEYDS